jgi:hypothetical protein
VHTRSGGFDKGTLLYMGPERVQRVTSLMTYKEK